MIDKRRLATAVIAFAIAMGSGHFVQYGPAMNAGVARLDNGTEGMGQRIAEIFSSDLQHAPQIPRSASGLPLGPVTASLDLEADPVARRSLPGEALVDAPLSDHVYNAYGIACDATVSVGPALGDQAEVFVDTPCLAGQSVEFEYGGLEFTERADALGHVRVDVPVLNGNRDMTITLPEGAMLYATMPAGLGGQTWRAALNWRGPAELSIRATGAGGSLGRVIRLGQPGEAVAELYGVPLLGDVPQGTVELVVEAHVTEATCGRDVAAKVWQPDAVGGFRPTEVVVTMPGCAATGQTLVLKNLIRDLKLAAN